jgi:hypothetical protein
MFITRPFCVETTWPQPTPQKGQTVVEAVAPRVLSAGTAGRTAALGEGARRHGAACHRARGQAAEKLTPGRLRRFSRFAGR